MTEHRAPRRAGAVRHVAGTALLVTNALLAACSNSGAGPAGSRLRVFAADVAGSAKVCEVPKVDPTAGRTTDATIKLGNDGGWCGLRLHQDGPKPFAAGLLMTRAAHGGVLIHTVGDDTRIDFTPDRGFSGTDGFAVKLVPGDAVVQVAVTVIPAAP
jgi:hypothetical protein